MKFTPLFPTLIAFVSLNLNASASTVWIGAANGGDGVSVFQEANWDTDGNTSAPYTTPSAGTLNPNTALGVDDYFISSASLGGVGILRLGNSSTTFNLDNSNISLAGTNGVFGAGVLNLSNASSFSAQFANDGLIVNVDGTSTLNLRGLNTPIPGATINLSDGGSLVFVNGTPSTLNPGSIVNASTGNTYSTTGDISGDFTFTGTQAAPTSITAIPEPSSIALLGLAALSVLRRRR